MLFCQHPIASRLPLIRGNCQENDFPSEGGFPLAIFYVEMLYPHCLCWVLFFFSFSFYRAWESFPPTLFCSLSTHSSSLFNLLVSVTLLVPFGLLLSLRPPYLLTSLLSPHFPILNSPFLAHSFVYPIRGVALMTRYTQCVISIFAPTLFPIVNFIAFIVLKAPCIEFKLCNNFIILASIIITSYLYPIRGFGARIS